MAPRGPWALSLRSLTKLSDEEKDPQHCLIVAGNEVLDKLSRRDTQGIFAEPVDTSVVTDYLSVVKHPMDLGTVREKLNREQYSSVEDFREDIDLIWDNCCLYNAPDTEFYTAAVKLREVTVKLFEQLESAFLEAGVQIPRRVSLHKSAPSKKDEEREQRNGSNSSNNNLIGNKNMEDNEKAEEARANGYKERNENVVQQEEARPIYLNGPKKRRLLGNERTKSFSRKQRDWKQTPSILQYTHFKPLLSYLDSIDESPKSKAKRHVADRLATGLESFFRDSVPYAKVLLSQLLNPEKKNVEMESKMEESSWSKNEWTSQMANMLLLQAGFQPSELSFDAMKDRPEGNAQVSKILWNHMHSILSQQTSNIQDKHHSETENAAVSLERMLAQEIVKYSPKTFVSRGQTTASNKNGGV
eukprot:jgi/Galph1/5487/GphlegSOOS_G4166.1